MFSFLAAAACLLSLVAAQDSITLSKTTITFPAQTFDRSSTTITVPPETVTSVYHTVSVPSTFGSGSLAPIIESVRVEVVYGELAAVTATNVLNAAAVSTFSRDLLNLETAATAPQPSIILGFEQQLFAKYPDSYANYLMRELDPFGPQSDRDMGMSLLDPTLRAEASLWQTAYSSYFGPFFVSEFSLLTKDLGITQSPPTWYSDVSLPTATTTLASGTGISSSGASTGTSSMTTMASSTGTAGTAGTTSSPKNAAAVQTAAMGVVAAGGLAVLALL